MARGIVPFLRQHGLPGLARAASSRLRALLGVRASAAFRSCEERFRERTGVEIGGPSPVFSRNGMFPVYALAARIDNCNFGAATVWEGTIQEGQTFRFAPDKPPGTQYIAEASHMPRIASGAYDFVLASHVLEHVANPILALREWTRLLKEQGTLVLVLPQKEHTFDHRRAVTTLEHLIEDHRHGVGEDDLTHLPEILALHDLERDPEAGDLDSFRERSARNVENRCLHHHVFDTRLAVDLVEHVGLHVEAVDDTEPPHILVVAGKSRAVRSGTRAVER